jgi:two-component system, NarL family, response regulator DevR
MNNAPQCRRTAVLVDQHPLWLDPLEQVVQRADVEVTAKLNSARRAHDQLPSLRPDLLITGIKMPDGEMDGVGLVREAKVALPELKVIVLSMFEDAAHIDAAFAAGADAYVLKTANADDLTSAIRQAFMPSMYLAGARPTPAPAPAAAAVDDSPGLTRRELEILQLVAEGHSNAQLAQMLWVTEQTVKFHLSNIYRKLNVSNRTEASRWAQLNGLLGAQVIQAA